MDDGAVIHSCGARGIPVVGMSADTSAVRFEFTIATTAGNQDVAITAPSGTTAGALRNAVLEAGSRCGTRLPLDVGVPRTGAVVGAETERSSNRGLALFVAGGRCAGTVRALDPGRFVLGRATDCQLRLADESVSRHHVELAVGRRKVTVRDLTSTNGCELDGVPVVAAPVELRPGQLLRLGNTHIGIRHALDEPRVPLVERDDVVLVTARPRSSLPPPERTIELPGPTGRRRRPAPLALAGAFAPAAVGAVIAWFTGSLEFLLFAAMSPVLAVSTLLAERLHWRRSRRRSKAAYGRAHVVARAEIADAVAAEGAYLRSAFPHPAELERIAIVPSPRLWERGPADVDFLRIRVGTTRLPARVTVRSDGTETTAGSITAAPVCVDLRAGPVGIIGPADACGAVARQVICQLAVLHSPAVVQLALVVPHGDASWHWARWLPHLDGRVATGPAEMARLAAAVARPPEAPTSAVVILVDAAESEHYRPSVVAALEQRCSVVYLAPDATRLPGQCRQVVSVDNPASSQAVLRRRSPEGTPALAFAADQVDAAWAERVARALAPLRDGSRPDTGQDSCPTLCDLLDVGAPDPDRIVARWRAAGHRPTTVLGRAGDGPLTVDLAADGPHCLIAGTTGAGKSELLRTLVTGLALNLPPSRVNFVLVDYKGGAAFAECAQLPHTAGLVTDLDAQLTRRALRSLEAEVRRREVVLARTGAADIDALHRLEPLAALPRLVVVVDEFATLAEELPRFVKGLIDVAQRGRSLGVHLVLATQRPGRAVTPEIKANVSLRVALRVTDTAESLDVIDAPDAAAIPQQAAGVAYLRRGDQLIRFRTALARPRADDSIRVELLSTWRRSAAPPGEQHSDAGLRAVVSAVRNAAVLAGIEPAARPWLAPLPAVLPDPGGPAQPGVVSLGLVDLPDEQRQEQLVINLSEPSTLLACGTFGSGRTNLLISTALRAARAVSPEQLEIYIVERGTELRSVLGRLPHVATAVSTERDPDLAGTLLHRVGLADSSWRLLLIDDWDAVLTTVGDALASRLSERFAHLVRVHAERGLTVLVTGDRSLLTARWAPSVSHRLLLRLADRADYLLAGISAMDVPATLPAGRGVRAHDGAEFQLCTAVEPNRRPADEAAAIARLWSGAPISPTAVRLRPLPDRVRLDRCGDPPAGLRIGVGGDLAAPLAIDPFGTGNLIVAGPPRSGRSAALLTLLAECRRTGLPVVAAAPPRSPLHEEARRIGIRLVQCGDPAEAVAAAPVGPAVLLVDDYTSFDETPAGDQLATWLRRRDGDLWAVVAGRTDELVSTYRGLGAEARRDRCGLLLRPTAIDGELLGVRLERGRESGMPPGRGLLVGARCWTPAEPGAGTSAGPGAGPGAGWTLLDPSVPVPVQIAAHPGMEPSEDDSDQPPAMCGYR